MKATFQAIGIFLLILLILGLFIYVGTVYKSICEAIAIILIYSFGIVGAIWFIRDIITDNGK